MFRLCYMQMGVLSELLGILHIFLNQESISECKSENDVIRKTILKSILTYLK